MKYLPLNDNAARQLIDSTTIYDEYRRAIAAARQYQGGMYWKNQGQYSYLVKTKPDNSQVRIGPRSEETEAIYIEFTSRKNDAESRLSSLRAALVDAERLNKALKVGRVPSIVVAVLQAFEDAGIAEHFVVVGTHALYAYETAAGVRITQSALATQDVDFLWDARQKVRFVANMERLNISVLDLLKKVDPSFQRKEDQVSAAINAKGFEIEFLRRMQQDDDDHPFQLTHHEEDLRVIQAKRANVLTEAPRFEHVVVAANGGMVLMRTIDPRVFVEFKRWMGTKSEGRPASKRRRDEQQALIVQTMLDEGILLPDR
jgi:hypothetical protein